MPARGPQTAEQDCAKIKQDIEQLQQDLADMSTEMQRLKDSLAKLNSTINTYQQDINHMGTSFSETYRGERLDLLAKLMNARKRLDRQIEDDTDMMQAIKDEIADLLNKLANCAPPSNAQPPEQEPQNEQPKPPSKPTQSKSQTSMSTTGTGIQFQLRGFGGATIINGNAPATAGFDGAVLFPLGNRILVGPTAGFQWVNSSIVNSIGSMTPGSTFVNTSAGFKEGNFGGRIAFPLGGWKLGIHGGATVAGSSITQNSGFCNATAGCTTSSSTTTHDTVVGPFVGGYISHSIFSHVGAFVEYDYHLLKDTKPNPTNPSGPSVSVFDLHSNDVTAGLVLSFGRHKGK
jgi:hypothetical protein